MIPETYDGHWTWGSWQVILLILNAVAGLIWFEWAWRQTVRFRNPVAELEELMPSYRRLDAPHWRKICFYPGAVTIMIPRLVICFAFVLAGGLCSQVLLCCHREDRPLSCWRKFIHTFLFRLGSFLLQLVVNFMFTTWSYVSEEDVNYYQEWLGPISQQQVELDSITTP